MRAYGRKAIEKVGRTQPAALLKIIALTLPKEHKVEHSKRVSELSDEQLNDMIDVLSARIEARAQGIEVPPLIDITPDGEVRPLPPPGEPGKPAKPPRKRANALLEINRSWISRAIRGGTGESRSAKHCGDHRSRL
jgi:hypothetical protein